jgi:hypothetical protein
MKQLLSLVVTLLAVSAGAAADAGKKAEVVPDVIYGRKDGMALTLKGPWALPPRGRCTNGAPSAGLSLGGLPASRARLRFTRRRGCTASPAGEQGQRPQAGEQPKCRGHEGRTG